MIADYVFMLVAADLWGDDMDTNRRWFLAGWCDERDSVPGQEAPPQQDMAAMAAYNSGRIASRAIR